MPVIAITRCSKQHDYEEAVRRAGGEVRILNYDTDRPAEVVKEVDGILLPGGDDVTPSLYGDEPHPKFEAAEPGRDAYELELAKRAGDADVPLFAICRGIQVLNVARGGTLVQDIPSQLPDAIPHEVRDTPFTIAHDVWVSEGTLLHELLRERIDGDACPVNSRHHQAVQKIGEGLVVSATAPDGVIEAVEDPSKRFCLGVQWHPENFYRTGEFRALFEAFVAAAGERV
ncbi:MAG TPA: gamma-glutamyl-gamma-aminobutyrate hydrolase family protein [Vicinamibacterales bacterium]|nr:gamma-glutamyl-gamma-aminobutyrate hydrolase family protein [Vicinamibacterales bacterium]